MTFDEFYESASDIIDEMTEEEAIECWNSFAAEERYSTIYPMTDLDSVLSNMLPSEVLSAYYNGISFSLDDYYFSIDPDETEIDSFTDTLSTISPWDKDLLIDGMYNNSTGYGNPEIEMLFQ